MRHVLPVRIAVAAAEAALCRLHARVISVCDTEAAAAHRWGVARAGQVRIVHTGVAASGAGTAAGNREEARAELAVEPDQVVVAWVGRSGAQKRPEQLAGLAERLPDRAVVVALGYGLDEDPGLQRRLSKAGVRILAHEDRADALLAAADLFVLTSAWEGFPLAVLEAMRAGLPVVGYAVGGLAEQVEDGVTGRLVEPDDARGLADRTAELVADPQERLRMSSLAEARSRQRFPLEAMLDGVERVYGELLDPSRGAEAKARRPVAS
jgi:glycosyltransferase involved in cell wall biosynthesis